MARLNKKAYSRKRRKPEDIKADILRLTTEFHKARQQIAKPFVPGVSAVPYSGRVFDESEILAAVNASLEFWLTLGEEAAAFEKELADYLSIKHVLLVNSGSSANLVAFMSLTSQKIEDPLRPGDEVITVAAAFPTTVNPIIQAGCIPVFVDIQLPTCNVDPNLLKAALSSRTRAVFLAHSLGNPFDVDAVLDFCRTNSLYLVEDNCDALGSRYKGRLTGTFGCFGTSSFYPPHHITMGEGGAVYTNDGALKRIAESLRDWGRDCWCPSGHDNTCRKRFEWSWEKLPKGYDHKYVYSHIGYNLKPTDIQAAIGRAQLRKLDEFVKARRRNWETLRVLLAPLDRDWMFMEATPGSEPSWFGFMMIMKKPDHERLTLLCRELETAKIGHRRFFAGNITRQPAYKNVPFRVAGSLENTDKITYGGLFLGVYPGLTEEMLHYVAHTFTAIWAKIR